MEAPLYLNEITVRNILTWPMVNEAVEEALKAVSLNSNQENEQVISETNQPERISTLVGENGILFCMPAFVSNYKLTNPTGTTKTYNTLACKIVTGFSANKTLQPPVPKLLGNIFLFNTSTGKLECFIEGTQITAWRTAAASIVATKYLYFHRFAYNAETHSIKLAIIGCGVQGRSHAFGMCSRFHVSHVKLWNRTASKAKTLAEDLRNQYPKIEHIEVMSSANDAVFDADVFCVGTSAPHSLIDYTMLTQHNVHINTVGAGQIHFGEVAQDIYDKATVYVDSWTSAKIQLAELKANIVAEVGEVINRRFPKPTAPGITIFQSMGMAAEDATVAQAVIAAYVKRNDDKSE